MRMRLSRRRRRGRGSLSGTVRPGSMAIAFVKCPSVESPGPVARHPQISVPATYGPAIAPPLPHGFDVVAVATTRPSRRPRCWRHG